jgi:hypothetical protein
MPRLLAPCHVRHSDNKRYHHHASFPFYHEMTHLSDILAPFLYRFVKKLPFPHADCLTVVQMAGHTGAGSAR